MKRIVLLLLMMTLLSACAVQADSGDFDLTFTDRELSGAWEQKSAVTIVGNGDSCAVTGKGAALSGSTLTISREGVYVLSGEFHGTVQIAAGDKEKVQLVLNNAVIASPGGPPSTSKARIRCSSPCPSAHLPPCKTARKARLLSSRERIFA